MHQGIKRWINDVRNDWDPLVLNALVDHVLPRHIPHLFVLLMILSLASLALEGVGELTAVIGDAVNIKNRRPLKTQAMLYIEHIKFYYFKFLTCF